MSRIQIKNGYPNIIPIVPTHKAKINVLIKTLVVPAFPLALKMIYFSIVALFLPIACR
jgi:hypothetical protein